MTNYLKMALLVLVYCFCFYSNLALADTTNGDGSYTTDPITSNPEDGIITSQCQPGQTSAMQINNTEIMFGQCYDTFALSYTINNMLQQEGISVDKVHYSWKYLNGCYNTTDPETGHAKDWCTDNIGNRVDLKTGEILDTEYAEQFDYITVTVEITNAAGEVIETRVYDYDTWYDWQKPNSYSENEEFDAETGAYFQVEEDFIQLYDHTTGVGSIYTPDSLGSANFRVATKDGAAWEGHYGPVFRDGQIWFTYRANPCAQTALYDPSCDGYSEAYATAEYDNNCSADALYDPGCPGYQEAYNQQQYDNACAADATYDAGCPGYDTAYYDQQCEANPLYDSGCSGYDNAHFTQQCEADPLYDSSCNGYENAYYNQQCSADPLYDSGCPGYDTAYYNYQCNADSLYDSSCAGYDTAYYNYQCNADPLYDSGCAGYDTAYMSQQCSANALYDSTCPGYDTAYYNYQCSADPLYDSACDGHFNAQCDANALYNAQCIGYETAYFNQQCSYNPQYDTQCSGYVAPVVADVTTIEEIIAAPLPQAFIILPQPSAPEPAPVEIISVVEVEIEIIPELVEVIEAQVEAEIAAEIEAELEPVEETIEEAIEEVTEEATDETNNEQEEPSGDVEQSVDSDGPDEETTEPSDQGDGDEANEDTTEATAETKPVVKKPLTEKQKKAAKERKMRSIIKNRLSKLADTMSKASTLADQRALQAQINALINYVPGFLAYGKLSVPGVDFYQPESIYLNKRVPENNRGLLNGLASQILHEKMVDEQYKDMD